jgi:hypothetical protein
MPTPHFAASNQTRGSSSRTAPTPSANDRSGTTSNVSPSAFAATIRLFQSRRRRREYREAPLAAHLTARVMAQRSQAPRAWLDAIVAEVRGSPKICGPTPTSSNMSATQTKVPRPHGTTVGRTSPFAPDSEPNRDSQNHHVRQIR